MRNPFWPLFDLVVRTPRLELRLPTDDELVELGRLAAAGIHAPEEMPFAHPWSRQSSPQLEGGVLQFHWRARGQWAPERWELPLGVWCEGVLVGTQALLADDFAVTRQASSGSWLGRAHQGRGIGREMRAAVVHLAFAGLGARLVRTEAFLDNAASLAVSRALGYVEDGYDDRVREGSAARLQRFRLERQRWEDTRRVDVVLEGLEPCLPMFGVPS